ncbi:hypothetical protein [Microbacterium sp. GXF0217]
MRVALHEVSKGRALPTTSLEFHSGAVRYALAETEQRPTVLGLIASGRMKPATGRVTIDGAESARSLRRTVALVDAPDVSDPHPGIALAGVVGEELMFAGHSATPLHARRWLAGLGYDDLASAPIGTVDPAARVRILCELAVLRQGVEAIVLVSPDRHGGSPDGWWRIAGEFADRGIAMLVILGGSAAIALERIQELGAVNASGPIEPLRLSDPESALSSSEDDDEDGSGLPHDGEAELSGHPVPTRAAAPAPLDDRRDAIDADSFDERGETAAPEPADGREVDETDDTDEEGPR